METKTQFFSVDEWRCKDKAQTPVPDHYLDNWNRVAKLCDKIRERWGTPIKILSGYRTPEYNRKVGGALVSQHLYARAADLKPTVGKASDLYKLILEMHGKGELRGLGGLGFYGDRFVHVDVRNTDHLVRWSG